MRVRIFVRTPDSIFGTLLCCIFLALSFATVKDASAATELYKMRIDNWTFPKSGQPVSTSCTITIDGQSASIGYVPANNYYCAYILYTCPEKPVEYSITIHNGTADKVTATAGTQVVIVANEDTTVKKFNKWIVVSGGTNSMLASASSRTTSFIMPAENVEIAASFTDISTDTGSGSTGTGSGSRQSKNYIYENI